MRIDSKLNLIVEVETNEGSVFVHSTPISRDVFERYYLVIGKTFSRIITEGLSFVSGPRLASLILKTVATELGVWDGRDGIANGFMAEIRRLSSVVIPGPKGWHTIPLQDAIDKAVLDPEDVAEVENLITFFICASAMTRRTEVKAVLEKMIVWGGVTTLLNSTEFAGSLTISTQEETSENTTTISSVPH